MAGHHLGHPALVHLDHPQLPPAHRQGLTFFGDVAEPVKEEPAKGDVLAVGEVDPEPFADLVDARPAVEQPTGAVDPDDGRLLGLVELVAQITDQGLEQVLDRQDPGHPAVLVHHDGERPPLAAHVGQGLEDPERFGHDVGRPDPPGDVEGGGVGPALGLAGPTGPEEVVHEEDAHQVVEIVVHHRKAAVARFPHGPGDVVGVHRDAEGDDVDPRGHDLPDVHVPKVGQGVEDQPLLRRGRPLLLGGPGAGSRGPLAPAPEPPASRGLWWRPALPSAHGCRAQRPVEPASPRPGAPPTRTGTGRYESSS